MHNMKSTSVALACLFLCTSFWFVGCNRAPKPPVKVNGKNVDAVDPYRDALESFLQTGDARAGDEWVRFRGGCDQLNRHFAKPDVIRSISEANTKSRPFVEASVHLTEDELSEVESTSFRTADAHYLDECFLLYDAAKSLEVIGIERVDQAEILFRWVMRNVLPHEQIDSWTPPAFTLRRGYGSPLERAMVCLALFRQSGIESCLIVVPDTEPKQILIAALDAREKESSLYLFDPRLGLPLKSKDAKTVLTVKEALDDSTLLQPAMISPEQAKKLEAWLVCPLYALSGRALELERGLRGRHPITLYLDADWLANEIGKATKLQVRVWNPPAKDKTANSPTRCLRWFLPKQEGGIDESGRTASYVRARIPLENIKASYAQIGIRGDILPGLAYNTLLGLSVDFFNKYELQPREMFLRGNFEAVFRRYERLQIFAKHEALVNLVGDKAFEKERENWLSQINNAAADEFSKDPNVRARAQATMNNLMFQDQFIRWMIEITKEKELEHQQKITVMARILAVGMREPLDSELARTQAAISFEKADHAQALLRARKETGGKAGVRGDWSVAKDALENFYLGHIALDVVINQRLKQITQVPFNQQNPTEHLEGQIGLLESLHREVHKYFQARLRLAECLEQMDGAKAANASLQTTKTQIEAMEKRENSLADQIKKLKEHLFAKARPTYHQRLDLLARDWSETGNFFWMKRQIDQRIAAAR